MHASPRVFGGIEFLLTHVNVPIVDSRSTACSQIGVSAKVACRCEVLGRASDSLQVHILFTLQEGVNTFSVAGSRARLMIDARFVYRFTDERVLFHARAGSLSAPR